MVPLSSFQSLSGWPKQADDAARSGLEVRKKETKRTWAWLLEIEYGSDLWRKETLHSIIASHSVDRRLGRTHPELRDYALHNMHPIIQQMDS